MKKRLVALGILCACLWAGCVRTAPAPVVAPAREPDIQMIDVTRDAPALQRIELLRQTLPEKYRQRNNFAWAEAKIEGLDKAEYFAHSGIKRSNDLSSAAAKAVEGISYCKRKGRFTALCVNHNDEVEGADCFPRYVDTEYKILEDMAARLPDSSAAGHVLLYTDLYPCASCRHVMEQFLTLYSNVQMRVLFRER